MRYKLMLTRSLKVFKTVDIPMDFGLSIGDVIQVDEDYHEIKTIIRKSINVDDSKKQLHPTYEEQHEHLPTLIISDQFPIL